GCVRASLNQRQAKAQPLGVGVRDEGEAVADRDAVVEELLGRDAATAARELQRALVGLHLGELGDVAACGKVERPRRLTQEGLWVRGILAKCDVDESLRLVVVEPVEGMALPACEIERIR